MVRFTVTSHWDSGYRAQVVVTNTTRAPIIGWKLSFHLAGAVLQDVSAAVAVVDGQALTLTPQNWDTTINPGGNVQMLFGFGGVVNDPTNCVLDGAPCVFQR